MVGQGVPPGAGGQRAAGAPLAQLRRFRDTRLRLGLCFESHTAQPRCWLWGVHCHRLGDGCKAKLNIAGQPGASRDLTRSSWGGHDGNDAKEAMGAQRGAGMGKGALVPAKESEGRYLKGSARFLPAIHSFVNDYFSATKFNIYFQQVAGGR